MKNLAPFLPVLTLFSACAHGGRAPEVSPSGTSVLVAGGGNGEDNVPATQAKLVEPFGVSRDPAGNLYIVEMSGNRLRKVDAAGILTTVAGRGSKGDGGDGGPGIEALLNGPHHLAVPADGQLIYIADTGNNRVRTFDPASGIIRNLAGTGQKAFGGDGGPAAAAQFDGIYCMDFDRSGKHLYAVDLGNRRIRMVDLQSGTVTTVAGNGEKGVPPDGAEATHAPLSDPRAVAVDSKGQVYILERDGHALRVLGTDGRIRTVAGTGERGNAGDGGDARAALFASPKHLTIDRDDSVLIADTENHTIRRYNPTDGKITRVAGTGHAGAGGLGGPPEKLELRRPHGVYVEKNGDLIVSDSENHRVVRLVR